LERLRFHAVASDPKPSLRSAVCGSDVQLGQNRSMFQSHGPAILFSPIDHHHDFRLVRGQVDRLSKRDEIGADLRKRVRSAFDDQKQLDV
jgi:hypothetical protein